MTREQEDLIHKHMALATKLATQPYVPAYMRQDAQAVAYLSLVKAANKFNVERGIRFSTYAHTAIKRDVSEYVGRYRTAVTPSRRDAARGVRIPTTNLDALLAREEGDDAAE